MNFISFVFKWFLIGAVLLFVAGVIFSPDSNAYDRSSWGGWEDYDGDCQDTRQELLIATSEVPVSYTDESKCTVLSGYWRFPYEMGMETNPKDIDIDHVMSLREVDKIVGDRWTDEEKVRFNNHPLNLTIMSRSANRSKGSRPPTEWMPRENQCEFLLQWFEVQYFFNFTSHSDRGPEDHPLNGNEECEYLAPFTPMEALGTWDGQPNWEFPLPSWHQWNADIEALLEEMDDLEDQLKELQ